MNSSPDFQGFELAREQLNRPFFPVVVWLVLTGYRTTKQDAVTTAKGLDDE